MHIHAKESPLGISMKTKPILHTGYLTLEFNEFCIINYGYSLKCEESG